ncbi:MAG: peroxidase-related enzyme [Cyclobacteriaceae bacterium]
MAFIQVIPPEAAEGRLKEIYDDLVQKRGKLAEVHKIQSLNPESIIKHMDLYMEIMFGKSPLRRYQREMIAVVVSAANQCEYCITHHAEALLHFWKDKEQVDQVINDFNQSSLNSSDLALCQYTLALTRRPEEVGIKEVSILKDEGFDDRAVLDAALVISYFNFVNRMVLGLGVALEEDGGKGYAYD